MTSKNRNRAKKTDGRPACVMNPVGEVLTVVPAATASGEVTPCQQRITHMQPELFEYNESLRRLTRRERRAAWHCLRWLLKADVSKPAGRMLDEAYNAMEKIKPRKRMNHDKIYL